MDAIIEKLKNVLVAYGPNVLAALIILFVGRIAAGIVQRLIAKAMRRAKVDETLIKFTCSVSYVALMAFVVVAAMSKLGIATTSFVAVLGAAGLAVGLALQGSLGNFASGVLLVIFKPFKVGDFVEAGGVAGIVEEIGIFNTELKTPDNKKIIVPNASVTGDNIVNFSANDTRRIDMIIGVSYSDDLDKVRKTIESILAEESRILPEPETTIGVAELGDSSINFAVRPWVKTDDYWGVLFSLNEEVKKRFDKENISIPFPQRDIHLIQENPDGKTAA